MHTLRSRAAHEHSANILLYIRTCIYVLRLSRILPISFSSRKILSSSLTLSPFHPFSLTLSLTLSPSLSPSLSLSNSLYISLSISHPLSLIISFSSTLIPRVYSRSGSMYIDSGVYARVARVERKRIRLHWHPMVEMVLWGADMYVRSDTIF